MQPPPFFVIGTSRSGTTMFRLMLNAHSRLLIPGETWFLADLLNALPHSGSLDAGQLTLASRIITGHWRWREWGIEDRELLDAFSSLSGPSLADLTHATFGLALARSSKARWGDKTPGYVTEVRRLHELLPDASFIHVIRDGRDVLLSLKTTGWHGESTWEIARYWGNAVRTGCQEGRALPEDRYLEVSYENLVLDTESVLRRVCDFLGEAFESGMLDFHRTAMDNIPDRAEGHLSKTQRPPRPSDVERWKQELPPSQARIFEAFAGDALELTGYVRRSRRGDAAVRGACHGFEGVATATRPIRRALGLEFQGFRRRF